MKEQIFTRNENGELVILNEIDSPDEPLKPDWKGLKAALWDSTAFMKVVAGYITVSQPALTAIVAVLNDGEIKGASQAAFFRMFAALNGNFSQSDLDEINGILAANNFLGEV